MAKIAIFGAGGFGREVQMLIEQIGGWEFIGFYDDNVDKDTIINGSPVLGGIEEINNYKGELNLVFAVGNPVIKKQIIQKVNNSQIKYPILIHPSAIVGNRKYVNIGEGTIITASTVITTNIEIGRHIILNLACTVGHDTTIKDYSSFMPTVNISGEVEIGECVYVGTGAKIINRTQIGDKTIVGAGAVVTKPLPANCTAVGVPAKPIKFN